MNGLDVSKKYLGLQEVRDRKQIMALLKSKAKAGDIAIDPSQIAWCAAWANFCERTVGNPGTGKLNARSFLTYGQKVEAKDAKPGDIVVFDFERDGIHGHVTFLVSVDKKNGLLKCLGGNQHNQLDYANYLASYAIAYRRFK